MRALIVLILLAAINLTVEAQIENQLPKITPPIDKITDGRDYYLFKDGKVWMMKGDSLIILNTEVTLANGSIIKPFGTVTTQTGETIALEEGDRVYLMGQIIKSQKR